MELKVGMRFTKTVRVTSENTALAVGSGDVEVFATPMMIALMEGAAAEEMCIRDSCTGAPTCSSP